MWLILPVLIVILTCCLLLIVWKRRRLYLLSWQLPGPLALPIIGCGLNFIGDLEGQLIYYILLVDYVKRLNESFLQKYSRRLQVC